MYETYFKRLFIQLAIAVLCAVAAPSFAAVTLPYSENFDDGTAPDFTFVDSGEWSISSGELNHSASGASNLSSAAVEVSDDLATTGIRMSGTINVGAIPDANSDAGFAAFGATAAFGLGGGDDHYLTDFKGDGSMRILKVTGAGPLVVDTIASAAAGTFSFSTAETYELIFEATPDGVGGFDLSLTIDDPSEVSPITILGHDATPLTGDFFGFRTRTSVGGTLNATMDDFALTISIPVPAALPAGLGLLALIGLRRRM